MESSIEKKGDYYCYCTSLLSLPESILDCILKRLSPKELITISQVCTNLRVRCRSDHLWENHIKKKWGKVFGDVAYKEWQWHVTKSKEEKGNTFYQMIINGENDGSLGTFSGSWPMLCLGSYLIDSKNILSGQLLLSNSLMMMMALYISLENGKFWFPAQVYRELLVSNALVSYDSKTNTFQARQQMGGWRIIGNSIRWDKVRAPPNETSQCNIPHQLSDSLHHLRPGDHIEIQWKASTEVPYVERYRLRECHPPHLCKSHPPHQASRCRCSGYLHSIRVLSLFDISSQLLRLLVEIRCRFLSNDADTNLREV
ncbi:hypothetical protein Ahy_A06g026906 [Arachis hypogaea]|uniref:F-box domain-containing protein n=1 Tax=Arachis hypogaea TaxID=3818 RepID=A0A445CM16_ARAHY|nr:hypothetical protein Ahy_A06g026906 [Arachis hypogaea]